MRILAVSRAERFSPNSVERDQAIFQKPEIDHGVVTWMNGEIDCSPEFMYDKSYEYESVG